MLCSHPIDPGSKRTSFFVLLEAEPEREMNILQQVSPLVGVGLVSPRETLKRFVVG